MSSAAERSDPAPPANNFLAKHPDSMGRRGAETQEQERISLISETLRVAVYEQKYTMLRHFDLLRWQIPGLVFAVGGVLIGFSPKMANGLPHYLPLIFYGLFALLGWYVMYRIRYNLRLNSQILRRFEISLGDYGVLPPPGLKSASTWMHLLLMLAGVASILLAIAGNRWNSNELRHRWEKRRRTPASTGRPASPSAR